MYIFRFIYVQLIHKIMNYDIYFGICHVINEMVSFSAEICDDSELEVSSSRYDRMSNHELRNQCFQNSTLSMMKH